MIGSGAAGNDVKTLLLTNSIGFYEPSNVMIGLLGIGLARYFAVKSFDENIDVIRQTSLGLKVK